MLAKILLSSSSLFLAACGHAEPAASSSAGVTLQINGVHYYVPTRAVGYLDRNASVDREGLFEFVPITVLDGGRNISTCADVKKVTDSFLQADDVIQDVFIKSMFALAPQESNCVVSNSL